MLHGGLPNITATTNVCNLLHGYLVRIDNKMRLVPDHGDCFRAQRGHRAQRVAEIGIGLQLLRVGDLELRQDGTTWLGNEGAEPLWVVESELEASLRETYQRDPGAQVVLAADAELTTGDVRPVLATVRRAGFATLTGCVVPLLLAIEAQLPWPNPVLPRRSRPHRLS